MCCPRESFPQIFMVLDLKFIQKPNITIPNDPFSPSRVSRSQSTTLHRDNKSEKDWDTMRLVYILRVTLSIYIKIRCLYRCTLRGSQMTKFPRIIMVLREAFPLKI